MRRTLKDILIFRIAPEQSPHVSVFTIVFPWDKNQTSPELCYCAIFILDWKKEMMTMNDGRCQPINNPFLGEKINYVDPILPEDVAKQIRLELAWYNQL